VKLIQGSYHHSRGDRQSKIDEKLTAGKLPKVYRWQRPLTHREAV